MRTVTVQFDVYSFDELKQQSCKDSAIVFVMQDRDLEREEDVIPEILADYEFYWDGQIYEHHANEVEKSITMAKFIKNIDVIDPDGDAPIVQVAIYKEKAGGIFGVDTSYIEAEEPVYSPFGNGEVGIEE